MSTATTHRIAAGSYEVFTDHGTFTVERTMDEGGEWTGEGWNLIKFTAYGQDWVGQYRTKAEAIQAITY